MISHAALRRSLLAAALASLAVLAVPGVAAASVPTCTDPFETPYDFAELQLGVAAERGFCAPDGSAGGGDLDWLAFSAETGHRYRIELVERGAGFDGAFFVIDEAYDGRTEAPQITPESPYVKTTSPLPDGHLTFSVTAVTADRTRLTGDDLGYRVLVTDLGPADEPAPAVASLALAASTVRVGASTTAAVILGRPAPAGGASVALSSSDARVSLPVTVTVPAGQDRVSVPVATSRSRARYTATITASAAGGSAATTLQVR